MVKKTQIRITRDLSVVKVSGAYPSEVSQAYQVLAQFKMVRAGSIWGLDGIAEYVANKNGSFTLNKSGISKRTAKQFLKTGRATLTN